MEEHNLMNIDKKIEVLENFTKYVLEKIKEDVDKLKELNQELRESSVNLEK